MKASKAKDKKNKDIVELCTLLTDQRELLWCIYCTATEANEQLRRRVDLANFLFHHALHVHEMAKAALTLMRDSEPYGVAILGRSALESAFSLIAAMQDRGFGPQRIAFELEDLSRKLKFLLNRGIWPASRRPTPEDCIREAKRIRRHYSAPSPTTRGDRNRIEKVEEIAKTAGLSPYYDDDYRLLSLAVHCNRAGILNTASGFLVRKGLVVVCNAAFLASHVLTGALAIKAYNAKLQDHQIKLESLMQKPDFLPHSPALG